MVDLHPQAAAHQADLHRLDAATLTPIVRRAVRSHVAQPTSWRWAPVSYAAYLPRRVLVRVVGEADVRGKTVPWQAVIKILEPPAVAQPGRAAAATAVWDREVRAYRSGILRRLPAGLAAPRLLHVQTSLAGATWLWLEHVDDAFGGRWPLAHYGVAARHLGRFNGAYAAARPLPTYRWLNQHWAESHSEPGLLPNARRDVAALLAHPEVRAAFPAPARRRMQRLLDDQPFFLAALASLPRTLCHHDASSANLFARRADTAPTADDGCDGCDRWQSVAIDWEEIGPGPLGAEAATLVFGTMRRQAFPAQRAAELEQTVLEGYQRGLREAGWSGDIGLLRLGYAAAVALRWFVVPAVLRLLAGSAPSGHTARTTNQPNKAVVTQRLALLHFLLDCADEARTRAQCVPVMHA